MRKFFLVIATLALSSCGMSEKASVDEEKEYPESLFTLGEMATVELEIPDDTWQKILSKAPDRLSGKLSRRSIQRWRCGRPARRTSTVATSTSTSTAWDSMPSSSSTSIIQTPVCLSSSIKTTGFLSLKRE